MATAMVIGAQWGDEGKGKIVDYLAAKADVVVRSQGGNNAGHTVVTGGKAYPLRLMPSGIMYPGTICIVGTGVVVDPKSFLEEMEKLEAQGINAKHLQISTRAQVVFPYHIRLDEAEEMRKGSRKLGTTKTGSGRAMRTRSTASASVCATLWIKKFCGEIEVQCGAEEHASGKTLRYGRLRL